MSTYTYSNVHNYNKIEYPQQKTRFEEEKDHASYAAIIEYSQMQEKLLINLRHQLEKIRGPDHREIQLITPSFANPAPQTLTPSVTAFKNAAIAARKLPSMNSRNRSGKQGTPTILNPKRDYPRPWALEKVVDQVSDSPAGNYNNEYDNPSFRHPFKLDRVPNPQKQFYSNAIERHQPIDCAFHQQYENPAPICGHCQNPVILNALPHSFPEQQHLHLFDPYGNGHLVATQKAKANYVPVERGSNNNNRPWNNNYYVTEELVNDGANSQFNTVVFPDPQAKKHPYLMKILEKTIPGNSKPPTGPSTQKYLKGQNCGMAGAVKGYNPSEAHKQDRSNNRTSQRWGSSRTMNSPPTVSVNFKVEESYQAGGESSQLVTKISSSILIGQSERKNEVTLLQPRCILSSLSPAWSQSSVNEKSVTKRPHKTFSASESESDGEKKRKPHTKRKEKEESLEAARAVTYQVFTNTSKKVLSEWEGVDHNNESKVEKLPEDQNRNRRSRSRNAQSSGDESYGSMKVIRDSKEDFIKRIYEDFQSYEDFEVVAEEKERKKSPVAQKRRTRSQRDVDKPPVVIEEPPVKAKDSRSLLRNQRLSFYKKKERRSGSNESPRKTSDHKLLIVKKSMSWCSQTGILADKSPILHPQPGNKWPPLVIDKLFPEVEKVLDEARRLSPYVDNMDKLLKSPPDLGKMIDVKKPWTSGKLSRFPTWFREVDPISKLGDNLTIDKVFQIDIKPGTFKCQPLEEFVSDSVGIFCGSKSTLCNNSKGSVVTGTTTAKPLLRKTTSQLVAEVKKESVCERLESRPSDTEAIRPITSAKVRVTPTKLDKEYPGEVGEKKTIPSDAAELHQAKDLAGKAAGTLTDINANTQTNKLDASLPAKGEEKVVMVGQAFIKSNFPVTSQNKKATVGLTAKAVAKIVLPHPKLKMTPEETTIMAKLQPHFPRLDRRQLKRLLDNPESYSHFDGTIDTTRLLKDTKVATELNKLSAREKTPKEIARRTPQSAASKIASGSQPRRNALSKSRQVTAQKPKVTKH